MAVAYRAKWLFDGVRAEALEDRAVIVEDRRIADVTPAGRLSAGTETIDLGEATLLPGLIDAHIHLIWDGWQPNPEGLRIKEGVPKSTLRAARHARDTLLSGVTTARDLGCPDGISFALRSAIKHRIVEGPRLIVAGNAITMTGGHGCSFGIQADGPDEVRKAARSQIHAGADFVKFISTGGVYGLGEEAGAIQLTADEMAPAVQDVHNSGRKVSIHAESVGGVAGALRAGADFVEHCNALTAEQAKEMAERGVYKVTTLSFFYGVASQEPSAAVPADYVRKARRVTGEAFESLRLAHRIGVKIAAGTDSGAPFAPHSSLRNELILMVWGGLPIHEALGAGTRVAAEVAGLADEVGTLEPGKAADLIAVEGNLLADITALNRVKLVVRDGQVYDRGLIAGWEPAPDRNRLIGE